MATHAIILTDDLIKQIDKACEIRDAECGGLSIKADKWGANKAWRLRTRLYSNGKATPVMKLIGHWPGMDTATARSTALMFKSECKQGIDPWAVAASPTPRDKSFEAVVTAVLYVLENNQRRPIKATTLKNYRRAFVKHSQPLYKKNMEKITYKDCERLMDQIASQVSKAEANKVMTMLGRFWGEAFNQGFISGNYNPAAAQARFTVQPNRTVLGIDSQIRAFFEGVYQLASPQMTHFFLLTLLTGMRNTALRFAMWSEIDWDAQIWTIPASRMKAKLGREKPYVLPLTPALLAILKRQRSYVDSLTDPRRRKSLYIFPAVQERTNGFGNMTVRRSDTARLAKVMGMKYTPHAGRRTMRTIMASSAIDPERNAPIDRDVINAVMGHSKQGLDINYNHYDYLAEKRRALELYHAHLERVVGKELVPAVDFGKQVQRVADQAVQDAPRLDRQISKLHPVKQQYVRDLFKVRFIRNHLPEMPVAHIAKELKRSETVIRRMYAEDLAVWFRKWESEVSK